jgi:hypothetical protein
MKQLKMNIQQSLSRPMQHAVKDFNFPWTIADYLMLTFEEKRVDLNAADIQECDKRIALSLIAALKSETDITVISEAFYLAFSNLEMLSENQANVLKCVFDHKIESLVCE